MQFIAEIGAFHEGEISKAFRCIRAAAEYGATAAKFQLFTAECLYLNPEQHERTKKYALPIDWLSELAAYAHQHSLLFGVSAFGLDLVEPLRRVVDFVKIAAYDLPYLELVKAVSGLGAPVMLSTAMATMQEIEDACQAVWGTRGGMSPLAFTEKRGIITLLHGVAQYPSLFTDQNLLAIRSLSSAYSPFCKIGLSDHTLDGRAACIATVLGAEVIEKHFRLDESDPQCPDYANAATPSQFLQMVNDVRESLEALGEGKKDGPRWCERPLYQVARRSNEKPLRGSKLVFSP